MNLLKLKFENIIKLFIEGKGIREVSKKIWNIFWKEIDRFLGIVAREIFKRTIKVKPNKIFFFTQEGRYCCNPKYICEELVRRNIDVEIVWRVFAGNRGGVPNNIKVVKAGTYEYYKEIFSSKVVIANSFIFLDQTLFLKKNQILLQTWHGSLGIKKFGKYDMKDSIRRIWALIVTGWMTDYCISNSKLETESLSNTYWKNKPMLEFGHARNDLFFSNYEENRNELKRKFCKTWNLDIKTQFVMYGPTFRDNKNFECYNIDFNRLIAAVKNKFRGEWCVLLRYHPSLVKIYKKNNIMNNCDNCKIIDVTEYFDMQELIAITDVAITDYSSWIYDFMLLRKPGFLFATDISLYNDERGFYYPLETTPFPIATNNDELEKNILNFDNSLYKKNLEKFLDEKGCVEDGYASKRIVDFIKNMIEMNNNE